MGGRLAFDAARFERYCLHDSQDPHRATLGLTVRIVWYLCYNDEVGTSRCLAGWVRGGVDVMRGRGGYAETGIGGVAWRS